MLKLGYSIQCYQQQQFTIRTYYHVEAAMLDDVEVSELQAFQELLKDIQEPSSGIADSGQRITDNAKARAKKDKANNTSPKKFLYKHPQLSTHYKSIKRDGWRIYVVRQSRGRCYYNIKIITIPTWAYKRDGTYRQWYVAHEIAHALAGWTAKHGQIFMSWLRAICPQDSLHHELGYKPRNASNAGITKPINTL